MSLPEVIVVVKNGGIGGVTALNDGIAGLIVSGTAAPSAGWALGVAKQFFSIDEVKDAGLNAEYDTANTTNAYKQVADFYKVAGDGAELWVMVVAKTETMEDICDAASLHAYAKLLLDAGGGTIRLVGVCRVPDALFVPTYVGGIDDDVIAALTNLEALAISRASVMEPFVGIIEGRDFKGDAGDIEDLKGLSFNRVAGVICSDKADKSAGVGLLLGRLAADPVMRKPGRVKTGAIPIAAGYFSDGTKVTRGVADSLDTKGWIVMTPYPQRSGLYWGVDNTCSSTGNRQSHVDCLRHLHHRDHGRNCCRYRWKTRSGGGEILRRQDYQCHQQYDDRQRRNQQHECLHRSFTEYSQHRKAGGQLIDCSGGLR